MAGMHEQRPTADALLARIKEKDQARLRIYIGAAPGVGKTYEMLQEAHALRARGLDVVVGYVETYGRRDTDALIKDLEIVPRRTVEYRGVTKIEQENLRAYFDALFREVMGMKPEMIEDDAPLFGEGLGLDSVDALELVVALEREFGIRIKSQEIGREVFSSVSTLSQFIEART